MNSAHSKQLRMVWLGALAGLLALLLAVNAPAVLAADFILDWSSIGFVDGTSTLQTFTNVSGSGVDMTTEFRVLDANFQDLGPYIPGTEPQNEGMPKPNAGGMGVRDISVTDYPGGNIGYILAKITFSQPIVINDLWMEGFFHWVDEGIRKHLALQAFDENGNAVVPVDWTIYGAGTSSLIVEAHPDNGQSWLRSSYPDNQTQFAGAEGIDYGNQAITELYWYSWGYEADDSLSHLLGSTYLGDFQFSTMPTAVTLVSADAGTEFGTAGAILPALLLAFLTTLVLIYKCHWFIRRV